MCKGFFNVEPKKIYSDTIASLYNMHENRKAMVSLSEGIKGVLDYGTNGCVTSVELPCVVTLVSAFLGESCTNKNS